MTARRGDAELGIVFNADENSFVIDQVVDKNEILHTSFNYETGSVIGKDLRSLLPSVIKEHIDDYLEIEGNDCNIVSILSRTRNFALLTEGGDAVQVGMRIQADVSMDEYPRYRMVIRDSAKAGGGLFKALDVVTQYEVLDSTLEISTEEFFYKKCDIVRDYIILKGTKATLAVIKIDKYDGLLSVFGEGTGLGLLHEVVSRCKTSFRDADVIGYFGKGCLAVVLLDSDNDSSRIPLNRLRSLIANQPMFYGENHNVKATVSIVFSEVSSEKTPKELITFCDEKFDSQADEVDFMIEA